LATALTTPVFAQMPPQDPSTMQPGIPGAEQMQNPGLPGMNPQMMPPGAEQQPGGFEQRGFPQQPFPGQQLPGFPGAEQQYPGVPGGEQQYEGGPGAEQQYPGGPGAEQQQPGQEQPGVETEHHARAGGMEGLVEEALTKVQLREDQKNELQQLGKEVH